MKKILVITGIILRTLLILAPGVAFGLWAAKRASLLVAASAGLGIEALFLFLVALVTLTVSSAKELRKEGSAPAS